MKSIRHSIEIDAPKEKIWQVLWDDKTFRDWANIIDQGTYMTGTLQEGAEVNFIGNSDGKVRYGVSSKVEKLIPLKLISFRKVEDIKVADDGSIEKRDDQWTGGVESYELEEHDGQVTLSIIEDVPDELVEYFENTLPKVLERIKALAEAE
ncbi:MAG TPA: SRPBCC domain-containing protein [Candidatus Paceibacterota bacterium]|jgi:uncharacterized protein YndB with AHSA1/START domain|nr:SRPBCC domain-containing protein [Candidatus Paceibacterota bacterium]